MLEIFVIGSMLFWLLILVEFCLFAFMIGKGKGAGAIVSFAVFVGLLMFFGDLDVFGLFNKNPIYLGSLLLGYIGIETNKQK